MPIFKTRARITENNMQWFQHCVTKERGDAIKKIKFNFQKPEVR
jgi:hypothetical protein